MSGTSCNGLASADNAETKTDGTEDDRRQPEPDLASTEKHNQFRTLGERVAKQVGVSLAKEPAWAEFTRVYGVRNNLYGHGQEEASMMVAVEARWAWEGLRAMLATLFATVGVTIAGTQRDALMRRAEDWSREDISEVEAMTK